MKQLFSCFLFILVNSFCFSATITVTFQNSPNGSWTADAKAAFNYAADEWESVLYSPREIKVIAYYEDLVTANGGDASFTNVLGYAFSKYSANDFQSSDPEFQANTMYPIALAEKLVDQNVIFTGIDYHIEIHMNSQNVTWHFDESFTPGPSEHDFISVSMHELGHGLGFTGSCNESGGILSYDATLPYPYDREVYRVSNTTLLTSLAASGSTTTSFLTSDELSFNGIRSRTANGSPRPKIYAPSTYSAGSSIYHWNQSYFPIANADALMHPQAQFSNRYFHRSIGNVTKALMEDIGWTLGNSIEELQADLSFVLYPNPSTAWVKILTANVEGSNLSIRVTDVTGKEIQRMDHFKKETILDVSDFEQGVYFVSLYTNTAIYLGTMKLIVN